jgi:HK97 family phage major capsid protein
MSVSYSPKVSSLESELRANLNQQASLALAINKNPEARTALDKLVQQEAVISDDLRLLKLVESKLEASLEAQQRSAVEAVPANVAAHLRSIGALPATPAVHTGDKTDRSKANAAVRMYLRTGRIENRDVLTTSDAAGGALIPEEFHPELVTALKQYADLVNYATVQKSSIGGPAKFPWVNDTANSLTLIATEGSTVNEGPDPIFGSSTTENTDAFNTGFIRASNELIDDSFFDFGKLISDLGASRYGRGLERILTRGQDGAGNATPNNVGLLNVSPVATTTTALANGVKWMDLTNLHDAIDPAYLPFSVWQLSSKTFTYLLQQVDSTGRPFFVPDPSTGLPTLLNRPVIINQSLPNAVTAGNAVANAVPILFGSVKHALGVRLDRSPTLRVFKEKYAEFNETAFSLLTRVASASLIPAACQGLKLAAS